MRPLPSLMVAPNGALKTKADHPALPMTIAELTATARACFDAGADGLHLHLRDATGAHLLDAGRYREALAALADACPDMTVQITTEAVGKYDPAFQRQLALETGAPLVSAAYREVTGDGDMDAARRMHRSCQDRGTAIQYILYAAHEVLALARLLGPDAMSSNDLQLLFVLGGHGGRDGAP